MLWTVAAIVVGEVVLRTTVFGRRVSATGGNLLSVLSAVIIGGAALNGGKGNVTGAVLGAFLIGLINNGLIPLGLSSAQQQVFSGVVIVVPVALTGVRNLTGGKPA